MRHISGMGLIVEVGEDEYKPTNFTKALSLPQIGRTYLGLYVLIRPEVGPGRCIYNLQILPLHSTTCTGGATLKFPEFARKRGWVNRTDSGDTSLMYTYGTDKNFFSWVQDSGYGEHLNDYFAGYNLGHPRWMDLINGANPSPNAPFLVDIGGKVGRDLTRFHSRYPDVPGKLILQDLPMMIRHIKHLDPTIIQMEHDFRDEQLVKGKCEDPFALQRSVQILNHVSHHTFGCAGVLHTFDSA